MKSPLAAHFNIVQDMASKYLEGDRCMVGVSNLQDLGDLRREWPCAKSALSLYFLGQRTLETQLYPGNNKRERARSNVEGESGDARKKDK
jgi:hypothetical protein